VKVLTVSLRSVAAAVLALGACSLALGASQASASHVSCGDLITEDTTLDSDLNCPASPALEIGADGIELDFDGHTVALMPTAGGAVILNDGHDGVTIKDGTALTGLAISLRNADHNRIENMVAFGGFGTGIALVNSDENRIVRTEAGGDEGGVGLRGGSDNNVVERSRLSAGIGSSLSVYDSDENLVRRNLLDRTETATLTVGRAADATTIARNELSANCALAVLFCGDGIFVQSEATNTLLVRNAVSGYTGGGFFGHFGDGIHVESPSTTLTRNVSNDNARWGIFAVPGVVDGGHNTASGNLVGQCLNVSC
jgi:parallel beta-helix repeat protein